jgi:ADP-ribose pyrophosphatase
LQPERRSVVSRRGDAAARRHRRSQLAAAQAKAKILKSREIFKGKVFDLREDKVSEPGGVVSIRQVLIHHGSIVVLPVFKDRTILLVRQYRHAAGQFLWELVAGHVEPGEKLGAAARRELEEEAGCKARHWRKLLEFFPSPGVSTETMWVFLATNLTVGEAHPEDDERIETRRFPLAELLRMIQRGTIRDAKTTAAILYYAHFVK